MVVGCVQNMSRTQRGIFFPTNRYYFTGITIKNSGKREKPGHYYMRKDGAVVVWTWTWEQTKRLDHSCCVVSV